MNKTLFFLGLLQSLAICHANLPYLPSSLLKLRQNFFSGKNSEKIVGGEAVDNCTYYPHQVSIQRKMFMIGGFSHFCGGSVINKDYVLTAAHCVKGRSVSGLSIVVGTHQLDTAGRNGIRRTVVSITVHEKYDKKAVDFDVAVIKLERSLDLEHECITPVTLPNQDDDIEPGTFCHATGYGTTSEGGSGSSTLRVVGVPVVSEETCRESYGEEEITPRMLCAGFKDGGKDACQGDSGGPLTIGNVQVGITSWGYGCARPELYGVYTRVSYFTNWILQQIQQKS